MTLTNRPPLAKLHHAGSRRHNLNLLRKQTTMQTGSNDRRPSIRISLWRNEFAQGDRDPFAKGKVTIPLDCLTELLDEWARGTLPVDRDGNAQLNVSAWGKKEGAHPKAPDMSGQASSPAELRDYYQRTGKDMPQQEYAAPLVPWDLPQSLQRLVGQVPAAPAQQGYQPAPVENYQQQAPAQPYPSHAPLPPQYQQAPAAAPAPVAATSRPLF